LDVTSGIARNSQWGLWRRSRGRAPRRRMPLGVWGQSH